ncbi:hypothetical protein [Paraburkholderia unamae]|uniref:Uncharacterized protein n=1 Tax=Paraburkholderia unamae TaxID=219649 RepID=A0ABX5KW72_9BURK|nr:hypothetical protein [Paraburkholderia unamae]PVX86458.1 hypothetical protein C7402_102294 [Paraburkholderia unamae]
MRLLIDVEVETRRGTNTQSFETTVYVVRRSVTKGVMSDEVVLVDAFIPPNYRKGISGRDHTWRSGGVLRCSARVSMNKRSLAPFIESGEKRWVCAEVNE